MKNITQSFALYVLFLIIFTSCNKNIPTESFPTSVTDIDGNVYLTTKIGNQVWMAENLKVTHYQNGDNILEITDNAGWVNSSAGAYCSYEYSKSNSNVYGYLYNWYAINDSRNIAPTGWHIPTFADWTELITHLGGEEIAGGPQHRPTNPVLKP